MSNFICWNILFYLIDRYLKFEIHSILIYIYILYIYIYIYIYILYIYICLLTLLNFEDDLVSLLEHQYDTAFPRYPYPACWFLFIPSHEDHNLSSTYQHSLFFCGHDLLYLEMAPTESEGEQRVQDGLHSVQPFSSFWP